jgi:hypothetical protein
MAFSRFSVRDGPQASYSIDLFRTRVWLLLPAIHIAKGEDSMLKIRSFVNATATAVLSIAGVLSAHAAPATSPAPSPSTPGLVFTSPGFGGTVTGSSISVAVQVSLQEDTASLKVKLNGQDISARLHSSSCTASSCTMQGTVATQDGLKKGQNVLSASVGGLAGTAGSVQRSTFDYQLTASAGDGVNTIQNYEPVSIGIRATNIGEPYFSITTGSTMNVNDSFKNFPTLKGANGVISIPYLDASYGTNCSTVLQAIALDRQTPSKPGTTACGSSVAEVESNLSSSLERNLNTSDLVILGTTPGSVAPSGLDTSSLGGTNYSKVPSNLYPQEYSMIGVPGATAGTAHESYSVPPGAEAPIEYHAALNGTLMLDQNGNYNYVPSGDVSFQVTSNASSSIQFSSPQYSAQYTAPPSTGGAFWLFVVEREQLVPINLPSAGWTNCTGPTSQACGGIFNVNSDGGAALAQALASVSPRDMIFLVAQGCPYSTPYTTGPLAAALPQLGASGYSVLALNPQFNTCAFSLVSVNDGKHTNVLTTPAALSANQNSAQGQTGSIHGYLALTNSGLYDVAGKDQVAAIDTSLSPTVDYTFEQTASAQRVDWPLTDTPGHLAAYHDISYQLLNDPSIAETGSYLYDMRYFYTNASKATNLIALIDTYLAPNAIGLKQNSWDTATTQEFTDAKTQLLTELQALNSSMGYLTGPDDTGGVEGILAGSQVNLFGKMFDVATDIATDAANAQSQMVNVSGANMANLMAGVSSIAAVVTGAAVPPLGAFMGVVSGALWTGSAAGSLDSTLPGPENTYDVTLSEVMADASTYSTNLQNSFGGAVDNIFSDPNKLETIGALTSNSDSSWNLSNLVDSAGLRSTITLGVTRSVWLDVLPGLYGVRQTTGNSQTSPSQLGSIVDKSGNGQCLTVYAGAIPSASWVVYSNPANTQLNDLYLLAEGPTVVNNFNGEDTSDTPVSQDLSNLLMNAATLTIGGKSQPGLNLGSAFLLSDASPLTVSGFAFVSTDWCTIPGSGLGETRQSPTTTQLAVDSPSIGTGQQLQVTVTVKSTDQSQNDMSGTIVLTANGKSVATLQIPANSAGTATVTSTMDGSALPQGTNGLSAAYSGDSGYLASSSNAVEITVGTPSFALTAQDDVLALLSAPGSQIGTDVTLTPDFGFNAAVQLSCSGLPANMSCSFDKSQLTVNGTPASAHVTFTNNGTAQAALDTKQIPGRGLGVLACGLVGLCFIRRRSRLVMLVGLVMIGSFLGGCGSSPSVQNPPTGSYTVNVKATGGGVTQTSKVVLNIQ